MALCLIEATEWAALAPFCLPSYYFHHTHSHLSCWPGPFATYLRNYAFVVSSLSRMFFPGYLHGSLSYLLRSLLTCCLLTEALPNFPLQKWTPTHTPYGSYPVFFFSIALLKYYMFFPAHFTYRLSPQWIWLIKGRSLIEFYLPYTHTEQCLACSWCWKWKLNECVEGPGVVVGKEHPLVFPRTRGAA